MLNPKWLTTFATLAQTGSFTSTAQQLFMTQPGVSQHIKKLETKLGEDVIFRQGKQFELTQAGILLLDFIAEQEWQHEQFLSQLKKDDPHQGEIRIACSGAMAIKLYSNLLDHQLQYPDLNINLEATPSNRVQYLLDENQIDIGISTQQIKHANIITKKLGQEVLSVVLPKKVGAKNIDFATLAQLGYINHPDGKHYADLVLGKNFPDYYRGLDSLIVRGYVNQLAQILLPVARGIGFTVLPKSVLTHFDEKEKLIELPLPIQISQPVYLAQKRHRQLPSRYQPILDIIQKICEE